MRDKKSTGSASGERNQIYKLDRWSRYQWGRFVDGDDKAQRVIESGREKLYSFPSFGREVFGRLFADDMEGVDPVRPEDRWAADAHRELGDLPDFDRLRRRCRADRITAGAVTTEFVETIVQKLPAPASPLEDPEQLREQVRGLLQFAKNLTGTGGDTTEVEGLIADLQQRGKRVVGSAIGYADGIDASALRGILRAACDAAHKAADQVEAQLGAFCGWSSHVGVEQAVGVEIKAELARRVSKSDKLQALARAAGRLRRIASAKQRSKADHAREEVLDIELGADLGRVLPSELVKLTDPIMSLEFARKFVERGLFQYALGGKEPQGRGPVVVCVDQSSSMEGEKEIWSKAMTLALLQVATMQKRRCRVIHFNAGVARVDDWLPGKVDPLELLKSMEPFYGGGTAFEPPLRKALEAITSEAKLKKADVIMVTDGEAEMSDEFRAEWTAARKKHQFTVYGIHVDAPGGIAPRVFADVADVVIGLADLAHDGAATDAVLGI